MRHNWVCQARPLPSGQDEARLGIQGKRRRQGVRLGKRFDVGILTGQCPSECNLARSGSDETIDRDLTVFERVAGDGGTLGVPWFFDHAETVSERNLDRIAALGGALSVQNRMLFQGGWFLDRYGPARSAMR